MIPAKMSCFFLQVSLIVLALTHVGLAIKCWECNSHFRPECEHLPSGPQDKASLAEKIRNFYTDCDLKNSSLSYKLCRKQVQSIEGVDRIIRSCGVEDSNKDCYQTVNPTVSTYVCQCLSDGCNAAVDHRLGLAVAVMAAILLLIQYSTLHV